MIKLPKSCTKRNGGCGDLEGRGLGPGAARARRGSVTRGCGGEASLGASPSRGADSASWDVCESGALESAMLSSRYKHVASKEPAEGAETEDSKTVSVSKYHTESLMR